MTGPMNPLSSPSQTLDVIIVGAGVAGLTAAAEIGRSGHSVLVVEARSRIGGRVFTGRDSRTGAAIEFGAEFIHGLPPEIWEPLQGRNIKIAEVEGSQWCRHHGCLGKCQFFSDVDGILSRMVDGSPDESFLSFLRRCCEPPASPKQAEANRRATAYVSGFNAADPARVGVHWLVEGMRAEAKIEGDRVFRSADGYADLLEILHENVASAGASIQTNCVVEFIRWKNGSVELKLRGANPTMLFARKALITLPLGVLQAPSDAEGAVRFEPDLPKSKRSALQTMVMGKVIRVTLRFKTRFWDLLPAPDHSAKTLADMSFLFTDDEIFPTWWTTMPRRHPIITGWAPFQSAERLAGREPAGMIEQAALTLGGLLEVPNLTAQLEAGYVHDWQSDPYSRGAYSYGAVGSDGAQAALAGPLEATLFFAGEATDITGHNGTVHGAIASGHRAAREILERI